MTRPHKLAAGRYEYRNHTLVKLRWYHEVIPRGRFHGRWVWGWWWFIVLPDAEEPAKDAEPHKTLLAAACAVDWLLAEELAEERWQLGLEWARKLGEEDRACGLQRLDGVSANKIAERATGKPWLQLKASQRDELHRAWKGELLPAETQHGA